MGQEKSEVIELLLHRVANHESEYFEWNNYKIGYFIQKNQSKSDDNEDVLFFYGKDNFCLFGVCDGAGGHPNAADASYLVGETIFQYVRTHKPEEFQIIDMIEKTNDRVIESFPEAFTTLSLCCINNGEIRSYSVGDSEIQYISQSGEVLYNNIPHSPVGHAVEAGLLSQKDSLDHSERYVVNNLIGDEVLRIEACSKYNLKKNDSVIVGSDGVFDNLSHEQISNLLTQKNFNKKFHELSDYCLLRDETWRKDDDVSFILLQQK